MVLLLKDKSDLQLSNYHSRSAIWYLKCLRHEQSNTLFHQVNTANFYQNQQNVVNLSLQGNHLNQFHQIMASLEYADILSNYAHNQWNNETQRMVPSMANLLSDSHISFAHLGQDNKFNNNK